MALNPPKTLLEFPISAIQDVQIDKSLPARGLETLRINAQTLGNMMICFDAEGDCTT